MQPHCTGGHEELLEELLEHSEVFAGTAFPWQGEAAELGKAQELLRAAWAISRNCHSDPPAATQGRLELEYAVEAAKGQAYHLSFALQDLLISCELRTSSEPVPSSFIC